MSTTEGSPSDLFPGELDWFGVVDLDSPITAEPAARFWQYPRVFGEAAKRAQEAKRVEEEGVYRFIQLLLGISPSFDDPAVPYAPSQGGPNWRNPIPSDLTAKDYEAIDRVLKKAKDPAVRARLLDYRFLGRRPMDYRAAHESVGEILVHVGKVIQDPKAFEVSYMLRRALQLVRLTGQWKKDLGQRTIELTIRAIREHGKSPYGALFNQCLRLAREFGFGDTQEMIALAKAAAEHYKNTKNEDVFRTYWTMVLEFEQQLGNLDLQRAAHGEMANSYVREVEQVMARPTPSNALAAEYVKRAIVALKQSGADEKRIRKLAAKQRVHEARIRDEMVAFSEEMDVTDAAHAAMALVKADTLVDSVMMLAMGMSEVIVDAVKEEVLQQARENPLFAITNVNMMDSSGRQTAVQRSLLNLEGAQYEQALLERMIAHAAQWHWGVRASSFINPARVQILRQWNPSLEDLQPIVRHNPFIPPGHESSFLRGIHAGLHGDMFVAIHLLVPQLENSIRHLLVTRGVPTTKLEADMSELFKTAGGLLSLKETEEIFGPNNLFEMRGLLYSEFGYHLRHRIAHGMITEAECQSERGLNAWWIMLRFCLGLRRPVTPAPQPRKAKPSGRTASRKTKPTKKASRTVRARTKTKDGRGRTKKASKKK